MKRVLFLLLIVVSAISVSAQHDSRRNDRADRYHYKYDKKKHIRDRNSYSREEYRRQVMAINHHFDSKVNSIRNKPFIGRNQKNRRIHQLEMQRRVALKECRDKFAKQRDFARDRRRR